MTKSRALIAVLLLLAAGSAFAADPSRMSVTVKETPVRAAASYLSKAVGVLAYGDRVTILDLPAGTPKGWLKVSFPAKNLQGFVQESALTKKEIVMKAGTQTAQASASSGDVALAGKGFNKEVEAQYKEDNKLDYTWVDKMEGFQVTPEQVAAFLTSGGLTEQGGAK